MHASVMDTPAQTIRVIDVLVALVQVTFNHQARY